MKWIIAISNSSGSTYLRKMEGTAKDVISRIMDYISYLKSLNENDFEYDYFPNPDKESDSSIYASAYFKNYHVDI